MEITTEIKSNQSAMKYSPRLIEDRNGRKMIPTAPQITFLPSSDPRLND